MRHKSIQGPKIERRKDRSRGDVLAPEAARDAADVADRVGRNRQISL